MFFVHHSCEGFKRVHRWRHSTPQDAMSGAGLQIVRTIENCTCTNRACEEQLRAAQLRVPRLTDVLPFFASDPGAWVQKVITETAAIVALGLTMPRLRAAHGGACSHVRGRRCWVGVASWKATGVKRAAFECDDLDSLARQPALIAQLEALPAEATLFWGGNASLVHWAKDASRATRHVLMWAEPAAHPEEYVIKDRNRELVAAFLHDVLGLNYTHFERGTIPAPATRLRTLPLAQWFFAPPAVLEDLAKLHVLLLGWMELAFPMEAGYANRTVGQGRWYGFVDEQLTVLFLTTETPLYLIGCEPPTLFYSEHYARPPPGTPGPITLQTRRVYNELQRTAPPTAEAERQAWANLRLFQSLHN